MYVNQKNIKKKEKKLYEYKNLIKFDDQKIKFHVELTPIINFAEVENKYKDLKGEIFKLMKEETIYKFCE